LWHGNPGRLFSSICLVSDLGYDIAPVCSSRV
jgi:hypothetical protein